MLTSWVQENSPSYRHPIHPPTEHLPFANTRHIQTQTTETVVLLSQSKTIVPIVWSDPQHIRHQTTGTVALLSQGKTIVPIV
ncbi:hypothetical protein Pla22_29970 [Rubripirellula amarantea]|uniref:Uncharacterized protein n=1 Tax=Rubripirellula amarantea TaxID=2527999 RepID=A0A5C5WHI8_9BACT|nr:hypothetical protein Pla22_29970 [Rubripirellula amarantea]